MAEHRIDFIRIWHGLHRPRRRPAKYTGTHRPQEQAGSENATLVLITVRSNWDSAWDVAGEFRDTAIEVGTSSMYTVRETWMNGRMYCGVYLAHDDV